MYHIFLVLLLCSFKEIHGLQNIQRDDSFTWNPELVAETLHYLKQEVDQLTHMVASQHETNKRFAISRMGNHSDNIPYAPDEVHKNIIVTRGYLQPETPSGFTAFATADRKYGTGDKVIFDAVRYNGGNDYSVGSSTYICPVAGYYYFDLHMYLSNNREFGASITLDRMLTTKVFISVDFGDNYKGSTSVVIYCEVNQPVWIQCMDQGELEGNDFAESTFSGFLISAISA